jgi:hypothetical protein
MATWTGAIVETGPTLWDVARKYGVRSTLQDVPEYALINCDVGYSFHESVRLAKELSRELGTKAIGFVAQTTADVYEVEAFDRGEQMRRLAYSRDSGGWVDVIGAPQPWEPLYFWGESDTSSDAWPDMLPEDSPDEVVARYEQARKANDPASVIDILHQHSLEPLYRLCKHLGVTPDCPTATWQRRSWWSRLFTRVRA